jgi:hypothetical protein
VAYDPSASVASIIASFDARLAAREAPTPSVPTMANTNIDSLLPISALPGFVARDAALSARLTSLGA